jgi:hypothetical protein
MTVGAAAHQKLPLLTAVYSNPAFHQELMHIQRMADRHRRQNQTSGVQTYVAFCPPVVRTFMALGPSIALQGPKNARNFNGASPRFLVVLEILLLWSIPDTWVTDYSGDMGNTFGPKGF